MMRQLLLDLGPPPPPTLDNFITGRNGAVLAALRAIALGRGETALHLWGEAGSGRSHLLGALGTLAGARYIACGTTAVPEDDVTVRIWCIDDVERAGRADQQALFNLINASRARAGASVITASNAAPLAMALPTDREDLRTRLGWGPVFQLFTLDDDEKQAAIAGHAHERGIALGAEVTRHLITHFSRDMPSLMLLIDALDRHALKQHRQVTLPLIREYLREGANQTSIPQCP